MLMKHLQMMAFFSSVFLSVQTSNMTSSDNTTTLQRCVVVLLGQSENVLYRKFVSRKTDCIYFNSEHIVLSNDPQELLREMSKMDVGTCKLVMALEQREQNLLSELFTKTHHVISDYNHDLVSESLLTKLTSPASESCTQTEHIYIKTLTMLTQHASVDLIVILTDSKTCDVEFSRTLANSIKKERAAGHSFRVMTYELKITQRALSPNEVLLNIQQYSQSRRMFIMLTSVETTKLYFEASRATQMNQYSDIWIAKHSLYDHDIIPAQTLTFTELTYKEYHPKQNEDVVSNEFPDVKKAICTTLEDRNELSKTMQKHGFLNDTKELVTVRLWWYKAWKVIYHVTSGTETFAILPQFTGFGFLGALGIKHRETLKIVSVIEAPFLETKDYMYDANQSVCDTGSLVCKVPLKQNGNTTWHHTCCYGYSVDLIIHLALFLGFQADVYIVEDGNYGGYDNNTGTFNGMVGDVLHKKADMAVAGLTINTDRQPYVDFTVPFMRAEIGIVTLKQITNSNYFTFDFIAMLGNDALYAMGVSFLVAMLLINLFDNIVIYHERKYDKQFRGSTKLKMYSLKDAFTYASGLLFQRELGGINPSTLSGRTVAIMFAFSMVAATTLYTASLTADRVVRSETLDFLGLKDHRMQNPTQNFKFATSRHTSIEDFFRVAPDEALQRMYRFMKQYNVGNIEEGINKVLSGELQAYLNEYPFLKYFIAQLSNCELEIHENSIGQASYGIAVAKDSFIRFDLSRGILYLQEEGILLDLEKKWLSNKCGELPLQNEFSLVFFTMPLLMLVGAIVLALFILLGEILVSKYVRRFKKSHRISGSVNSWTAIPESRRSILIMYK